MSEAFQSCYEDLSENRANESVKCFKELVSSVNSPIFLIFTKLDCLEEIINRKKVSFQSIFSEFKGNENNIEEVKEFIINRFIQADTKKKIKSIHLVNTLHKDEITKLVDTILNNV